MRHRNHVSRSRRNCVAQTRGFWTPRYKNNPYKLTATKLAVSIRLTVAFFPCHLQSCRGVVPRAGYYIRPASDPSSTYRGQHLLSNPSIIFTLVPQARKTVRDTLRAMTQILPSLNIHGQPRPEPGLESAYAVNAVSTLPVAEVKGRAEDQTPLKYLVVSPYTEQDHLLDLDTLDAENRILATALLGLKCLRADYATAPYKDTFNWPEVIELVRLLASRSNHRWRETSFYTVAFRSQIPPTTKYEDLGVLDKAAHAEATASGGFLKSVFNPAGRSRGNGSDGWLTRRPDIGLGFRTKTAATWQRASGVRGRMRRKAVLDQLIGGPAEQHGHSTAFGESTGTGSSSVTMSRAGTSLSGWTEQRQTTLLAFSLLGMRNGATFGGKTAVRLEKSAIVPTSGERTMVKAQRCVIKMGEGLVKTRQVFSRIAMSFFSRFALDIIVGCP